MKVSPMPPVCTDDNMAASLDTLWREPQLRPLAPLVLAAWHDGHLTPAELLAIREAVERGAYLSVEAKRALGRWLDPNEPPPPRLLRELGAEVERLVRALPPGQRRSLSEIGAALGAAHAGATHVEEARALLSTLEQLLASDDTGQLLGVVNRLPSSGPQAPKSSVLGPREVQDLRALLDGNGRATREELRVLLSDARYRFVSELSTHEYRAKVREWLVALAEHGVIERCYANGLEKPRDLGRFVATFEMLSYFDLSLVVKFGVQAGLFAGAVESLGTERHHALLPGIVRGELLGCFAMTERAHGSNVRSLLTTARYEPESESFVLSTPSLLAGKEWIGNAARDGRMAVVFAQLETLGESYGVHAFLIDIRDESGEPRPGVRIEDCGEKMGLNGVDNGRLWFDDVRIPRSALLDRFGQVTKEGEYQSAIPSSSKRFFTMLSTLVGGRVSVACGATSAAKVGLAIALRYAGARTQFPDSEGNEKRLIDYLSHQRRLIPRLSAAYAFSFAQQELLRRMVPATSEQGEAAVADAADIETLAAGLKAMGTWQAIDTLQHCRECCGGQGYLTANRIDALRTDTDVFTTFEGDNTVLLQLVANNLLRELRRAVGKRPVRTMMKSLLDDVVSAVTDRNPLAVRNVDDGALRSFDLHVSALRFREKTLLLSLARRVRSRVEAGMDGADAFDECQDHALALARAHTERFVVETFQEVATAEPLLEPLCALYGLFRIESDLAWFLENGFLAPAKSRAIRKTINELVRELAPLANDLVEAFGIPSQCLGPLADRAYLESSGLVAQRSAAESTATRHGTSPAT
jgi:acyl-CoA oxidase